jgi:death-on-curing protein
LPSEPEWLTEADVVRINQRLVARTGEPHFLREPALLSSALARPRNRWAYHDYDIVSLAGSLLLGIGRNHPFEQGNKRTALASSTLFLLSNGYAFVAPDGEPLGMFVERSLTGSISEARFMDVMRTCTITTEAWEAYQRQKTET